MIRLEAAYKISITNKPTNEKLNVWKPLETKPRKDELWQAILVPSWSATPPRGVQEAQELEIWSVHDMVKYLMTTSAITSGAQGAVGNSEGHGVPHDTVVPEITAIGMPSLLFCVSCSVDGRRRRAEKEHGADTICGRRQQERESRAGAHGGGVEGVHGKNGASGRREKGRRTAARDPGYEPRRDGPPRGPVPNPTNPKARGD